MSDGGNFNAWIHIDVRTQAEFGSSFAFLNGLVESGHITFYIQ